LERPVAQGDLRVRPPIPGHPVFAIATREDEADIRRLLRQNALDGWIRLSLEREPDAFAADFGLSHSHAFILARDPATGEVVGLCERSARDAYLDGEVRRLPYLGALRVAPGYRHRIRVLKGGFGAVRLLRQAPADLPFALTAISAGNTAARRVLCAGLAGMPDYRPFGEMLTFALRTAISPTPPGVEPATREDIPAIAVLLQRAYRRYQLAPVWRAADLEHLLANGGLRIGDILVVRRGPGVRACLVVWDQSCAKQAVVRGYAPWLRRLRPLINLAAPLACMPRLPPAGSPLRQAYLSHVAVEDDDPTMFRALLAAGSAHARRRGLPVALIGFATGHPFAAVMERQRAARYRSLLHLVHWRDACSTVEAILPRTPHPEIALL
jgi:hypothetical protein